ncbi:MAG: anaerobic ribonucleoside-triphosphate reductase [Smithellaceae bacterium]|nr:anaerobic ribonucleoside-triphosphate reductase [Smithellaceae bacterium]
MTYVKSLFDEQTTEVEFCGKCHDCGKETAVLCSRDGEDIHVEGGAYWRKLDRDFVKCSACFDKEPKLTNFQPCEIYSRVVGYLRPVQQWNPGKKEEFRDRRTFKL